MTDWDKIKQDASDRLTLALMEINEAIGEAFKEVREALKASKPE